MSVVAKRYAKALMNLAAKDDQVEAVSAALDDFAETLAESALLTAFLAEPKVTQSAKEAVVADVLGQIKAPALVETFLRFLTYKRRIALTSAIREVFHELADARMGRANADVTVAAALTDKQADDLRARLETLSGKQVQLRIRIDPSILGGIVARIGSTVWDGSIRHQLNQIHQQLIQA